MWCCVSINASQTPAHIDPALDMYHFNEAHGKTNQKLDREKKIERQAQFKQKELSKSCDWGKFPFYKQHLQKKCNQLLTEQREVQSEDEASSTPAQDHC